MWIMRKFDIKIINMIDMKVKEAIKIIEQDGWFMVRMKGTFQSILFQTGLKHGRTKSV